MVITIALIYGYVNYLETIKRDKPIYWFLTWEDETTLYVYAGLTVFFSAIWFVLAQITLFFKPRVSKEKKK